MQEIRAEYKEEVEVDGKQNQNPNSNEPVDPISKDKVVEQKDQKQLRLAYARRSGGRRRLFTG